MIDCSGAAAYAELTKVPLGLGGEFSAYLHFVSETIMC